METKLTLNLKMSQKLVMTPMLQQAIKLLPLARMELAQLVQQEITDNPVLEELLEEFSEEEDQEEKNSDDMDVGLTKDESNGTETESSTDQEIDWDNYS